MPCDSQRNRKQDKKTDWDNAKADVIAAAGAAAAATLVMYAACAATLGTGGALAPGCVVALAALATLLAAEAAAVLKSENAREAYRTAKGEYDECMSKLRPAAG